MTTARVQHRLGPTAPARWLHPVAWWAWALGLATAASRTTNPLVLGGILVVVAVVVRARRPDTPWARSFWFFLALGASVVVVRVVLQILLGAATGGPVLFTLPEIPLPQFLITLRIGGAVTSGALLFGLYDGLRLATLLICVGAASSLAAPSRMLKAVPAALYEVGVAVVVTLTFVPQMMSDLVRVRAAQRLRGRRSTGLHGWITAALPVLHGGLERSVALAAAMDSRGYGRRAAVPGRVRAVTQAMLVGGLLGVVVGLYGLLDSATPAPASLALLIAGAAVAAGGLAVAGRRSPRSRYRPDPWALPEWIVTACGVAVAGTLVGLSVAGAAWLAPGIVPAEQPLLPPVIVLVLMIGMVPAWAAPPVPWAVRRRRVRTAAPAASTPAAAPASPARAGAAP